MKNDMKDLANWIFTYCPIREKWLAAKRENYHDLFNDNDSKNVIKSSKIETLMIMIHDFKGDINQMNNL